MDNVEYSFLMGELFLEIIEFGSVDVCGKWKWKVLGRRVGLCLI